MTHNYWHIHEVFFDYADNIFKPGNYYIQTNGGNYLTRGQTQGREIITGPYGLPWRVELNSNDGTYTFKMIDIYRSAGNEKVGWGINWSGTKVDNEYHISPTLGEPAANGKWDAGSNTYSWKGSTNNLMNLFSFDNNNKLSKYKSIRMVTSNLKEGTAYRLSFMKDSEVAAEIHFYSAGEKNIELTPGLIRWGASEDQKKEVDLNVVTSIRFGGRVPEEGYVSLDLSQTYLVEIRQEDVNTVYSSCVASTPLHFGITDNGGDGTYSIRYGNDPLVLNGVKVVNGSSPDANDIFKFLTADEYKTAIAEREGQQKETVLDGKTNIQLQLNYNENIIVSADQPKTNNTNGWTFTDIAGRGNKNNGDYGSELFEAGGKYSKTYNGLTNGLYKVRIKALFRSTNFTTCSNVGGAGYPLTSAYMNANGSIMQVKDWFSGHTGESNPNSTAEFVQKANDYVSEVYTKVTNGTLQLDIVSEAAFGASWFIVNSVDVIELKNEAATAFYIQDVETGRFLTRGQNWGTRAVEDEYGLPWMIKEHNTGYRLLMYDIYLKETTESKWLNNDYTDNGVDVTWHLDTDGDTWTIKQGENYLDVNDDNTISMDSPNPRRWRILSPREYSEFLLGRFQSDKRGISVALGGNGSVTGLITSQNLLEQNLNTTTLSADLDVKTWTFLDPANPRGGNDNQGDYGRELYIKPGSLNKTINVPGPGLYKIKVKALFRSTSSDKCKDAGDRLIPGVTNEFKDYLLSSAYFSANGYTVPIKDWYSGYSDTDNPNNTAQFVAKLAEGKYATEELYTIVGEDCKLHLSAVAPAYWTDSWFIINSVELTWYEKVVKRAPYIEVTADGDKTTLPIGDEVQLRVLSDNSEAGLEVTYVSSDPDIATVDNNGLVTGVAPGEVTITVKYGATTHFYEGSATISISVGKKTQEIRWGENLRPKNICVGEEIQIGATAETDVTYRVVDGTGSATIVGGNTLRGLKSGTVTVWAEAALTNVFEAASRYVIITVSLNNQKLAWTVENPENYTPHDLKVSESMTAKAHTTVDITSGNNSTHIPDDVTGISYTNAKEIKFTAGETPGTWSSDGFVMTTTNTSNEMSVDAKSTTFGDSHYQVTYDAMLNTGEELKFWYMVTGRVAKDKAHNTTGGSITFGADKFESSTIAAGGWGYKLDGDPSDNNTKYVIKVNLDKALAAGDIINLRGYVTSKPTSDYAYAFRISPYRNGNTPNILVRYTKKNTEETLSYTIPEGSPYIGTTEFYITRNVKSVYFTGIEIAHPGASSDGNNFSLTFPSDGYIFLYARTGNEKMPAQAVLSKKVFDEEPLTADMFKPWTAADETGEEDDTRPAGCAYDLNVSTGMPYGDGNVYYLNYADLSDYKQLKVTASAGQPRFLLNRDVDKGSAPDHLIAIPDNQDQTAAYQTVVDNGDGTKTYIIDLETIVADKGYAHLHAIKEKTWQAKVTVTKMTLVKKTYSSVDQIISSTLTDSDEPNHVYSPAWCYVKAGEYLVTYPTVGINLYAFRFVPEEDSHLDATTAIRYTSSDPSVATIDETTGIINALKTGFTVISAVSEETSVYSSAVISQLIHVYNETVDNGVFIRIKNKATGNYIAYNGETVTTVSSASPESLSNILYYEKSDVNAAGPLLFYGNGRYLSFDGTNKALADANYLTALTDDKYKFKFTAQNTTEESPYYIANAGETKMADGGQADDNQLWYVEQLPVLPVTIGETRYATLYSPVALSVPAGVKAYIITSRRTDTAPVGNSPSAGNCWLMLRQVMTITPNTPVVIIGDAGTTYQFPITASDLDYRTDCYENVTGTICSLDQTNYSSHTHNVYTLQKAAGNAASSGNLNQDGVGFYPYSGQLKGFRIFIDERQPSAAGYFRIGFEDEEGTLIDAPVDADTLNVIIYDLLGRPAQEIRPGQIYIVNGKRMIGKGLTKVQKY
ncbi:MAG: Ig-like domain-containing protein [Bacteroidales bacterium]|nr:Ig-like domain-containing protein [Candidatus Liminaster caballi]